MNGGSMFKRIKNFFKQKNEIKKLKYQIESLKFDILSITAIAEKYFPLMKSRDKVQLLILRRCLWTKK